MIPNLKMKIMKSHVDMLKEISIVLCLVCIYFIELLPIFNIKYVAEK